MKATWLWKTAALATPALSLAACLAGPARAAGTVKTPAPFTLSSPAFKSGAAIPAKFTCEGENVSPALEWSGVPAGARSFALVVEDPDAPDPAAPKTIWTHWVLYNLPPAADSLAEGVAASKLPAGARPGRNDWKRAEYGGACPPIGRHRYFFHLYALDRVLEFKEPPGRAALLKAMEGHTLARAELMGTYQKAGTAGGK